MVRRSTPTFPSPASRPRLFDLPKDISFLEMQQPLRLINDTNSSFAGCATLVRQRLASSLAKATERADELRHRMAREDIQNLHPSVHEACSALISDLSRVLNQATLLLDDAKQEDQVVCQMHKNKCLSVALIHALQYLETLEAAISFSSRDRLETGISSVLDAIKDTCKDEESSKVFVSSWAVPSLAFDFQAGRAASLSILACHDEPLSLPMDLEVRPIIQYTAEDLVQSSRLKAYAFAVTVEKCTHEVQTYGTRDGLTGEATVQVHIAPLAESERMQVPIWGRNDDVEPLRIKEVRAIQQNAYPTKFRINFDMFTSSVYGESGVTLKLAMETCQTMDGKVPKVLIELVVDP